MAPLNLLEGETLRRVIDRGPLAWRRAIEIALAVAEGLSAAHTKGMVHRDVKPENIFITTDDRVKVLDFGLALWTPLASTALETELPTATAPGLVLGTFGYMSPEQVRGVAATLASDVFSLGCVLYEMASGQRAFARPSAAETFAAVLKEEPPELESGIPLDLKL
jgi:serine/threonine protein kinase